MAKDTQVEYAVKIIDLTGEKDGGGEEGNMDEIRSATKREINILKMVQGHQRISK